MNRDTSRTYIVSKLGNAERLEDDEIAELVTKAKGGCTESRNRVVCGFLPLVVKMARRKACRSIPADELVGHGCECLVERMVSTFNPAYGVKFYTYLSKALWFEMDLYIIENRGPVRVPGCYRGYIKRWHQAGYKLGISEYLDSLGLPPQTRRTVWSALVAHERSFPIRVDKYAHSGFDPLGLTVNLESPVQDTARLEAIDTVDKAVSVLDYKELRIIKRRFGLGGLPRHTSPHCTAQRFGMTIEEVNRIESESIEKMKGALCRTG